MRNLFNKMLLCIIKPIRSEKRFSIIPDNMENITNQINKQLLQKFHDKITVMSDGIHYIFMVDGKSVYWGNIDNNNIIKTIHDDMEMYPALIQDSINEFTLGDKYIPDMISIIPELVRSIKNGTADVKQEFSDTVKINFKPKE